jgi:hypothetical protein
MGGMVTIEAGDTAQRRYRQADMEGGELLRKPASS